LRLETAKSPRETEHRPANSRNYRAFSYPPSTRQSGATGWWWTQSARTRLRGDFPANREKNRESAENFGSRHSISPPFPGRLRAFLSSRLTIRNRERMGNNRERSLTFQDEQGGNRAASGDMKWKPLEPIFRRWSLGNAPYFTSRRGSAEVWGRADRKTRAGMTPATIADATTRHWLLGKTIPTPFEHSS